MPVMDRKKSSEFVGAVWEADVPIGANRHAEMAVLFLALSVGDAVPEVLARVESRDFLYDDCRFVFTEVVAMQASGVPSTDKAAIVAWFGRPEVLRRMTQAKLDWIDDAGKPNPYAFIYALMLDGQFATLANLDFYVTELRRWRVTRGLRSIAWDLSAIVNGSPEKPLEALEWLRIRTAELGVLAETLKTGEATA